MSNNNVITNKQEIATKFNEYFTNIGRSLADKILKPLVNHASFLNGNYIDSFSLFLTNPTEVTSIVNNMVTKKSSGFDNISIEVIKLAMPFIAEPLSSLGNNSSVHGVVPDALKIARV